MEKPIVVLIDIESGTVSLFGKYNKTLSIHDVFLLQAYIDGENVIYVLQAEEAEGSDVAAFVQDIANQSDFEKEKQYIRYIGEGYKRISDIKLTFAGPKDAKMLERIGYDIFQKSPQLKKMLQDGEIEVLSESEVKRLKKPLPDQKAKDKQLDSILLNKKEDALEMDDMFKDENEVIDDGKEILTEAESIIMELKKQR